MRRIAVILFVSILVSCQKENPIEEEKENTLTQDGIEYFTNAQLISPEALPEIDSVTEHSIILNTGSSSLEDFTEGQVLIADVSSSTPYGLFRKVKSIEVIEGQTHIITEDAIITDVIKNGRISQSGRIQPQEAQKKGLYTQQDGEFIEAAQSEASPDPEDQDFYYKLDLFPLHKNIELSGFVGVSFDYDLDVIINDAVVEYLEFWVKPSESHGLKLYVKTEVDMGNLSIEKAIFEYPHSLTPIFARPRITLFMGPFPLIIFPQIEYVVGVTGHSRSKFSTGAFCTTSIKLGIKYEEGKWTPIGEKEITPGMYPLVAESESEFELFWGPELVFGLYSPLIGPEVYLNDYFRLKTDISSQPWWQVDLGLKAGAAIDVDCKFFALNYSFWEIFDEPIWHWEAESEYFNPAIILTTPENGAIDQDTELQLSWTSEASLFDVYCDQNPDPVTKINSEDILEYSYTLSSLEHATTYYWKVVARNEEGKSADSEVFSFTIREEDSQHNTGTVSDIDGNTYKTVEIGDQWWMAENLATTRLNDGTGIFNQLEWGRDISAYCWYENDISYKEDYGAYYTWHTLSSSKLCPEGWHVPYQSEWDELIDYAGGLDVAGEKLKSADPDAWDGVNENSRNEYGFSVKGSGKRLSWAFNPIGYVAMFWAGTVNPEGAPHEYSFNNTSSAIGRGNASKDMGLSVRCVQNIESTVAPIADFTTSALEINVGEEIQFTDQSTGQPTEWLWNFHDGATSHEQSPSHTYTEPGSYHVTLTVTNTIDSDTEIRSNYITVNSLTGETGTVTDIDGNNYATARIGNQWWMTENLATIHLNDGTPIAYLSDKSEWANTVSPAYSMVGASNTYTDTYGLYYNGYVAINEKVCPAGWHVPTDAEWQELESSAGMPTSELDNYDFRGAGIEKKLMAPSNWYPESERGTNETGFSALGAGKRLGNGSYTNTWYETGFWTSSPVESHYVVNREIYSEWGGISRSNMERHTGYSLRCVKDE